MFFAVTGGCMDPMVNHYTASKRKRTTDAYSPDGAAGYRPDYATTVYSNILKDLFPQEILLEIIERKKNSFIDRNTNSDYKRLTFFPAEIYVIGNKYDSLEIREM